MLKKGDILLIRNWFDPFCWIISWCTKSKWTHTAWILDNKWLLESRSSGVVKNPISKYLSFKHRWIYSCRAFRLKGDRTLQIRNSMRYGLKLHKKRHYFKFLWSLFLIGVGKRREKSHMSCSGFVAYCLSKEGIKLHKTKNPLDVVPGDIAKSKELKDVTAKDLRHF